MATYSSGLFAQSAFRGSGDTISAQIINGALHPYIVLQHLLLLIVVGFLVGRQESRRLDFCAIAGGFALIIGLAFSPVAGSWYFLVAATLLTVVAGLLVALGWWSGPGLTIAVVALSCLVIGLDTPAPPRASTQGMIAMHVGTCLGVGAALFYTGYVAYVARARWLTIGLRILASWLTAVSVMLLALKLAPPAELTQVPDSLIEPLGLIAQTFAI